jgi:cytochrome c-type biogenesis protein CcmE
VKYNDRVITSCKSFISKDERVITMNAKTMKILATAAVLVAALGGLMYTSLAEGTEYYKHVDEVMVDQAAWQDKKLQLHGFVVEKSIQRRRDSLDYIFKLEKNGYVVNARYTGLVPDTFKDNAETVIKGRFSSDGTFMVEPNGVMAKCPSRYESSAAPRPSGT